MADRRRPADRDRELVSHPGPTGGASGGISSPASTPIPSVNFPTESENSPDLNAPSSVVAAVSDPISTAQEIEIEIAARQTVKIPSPPRSNAELLDSATLDRSQAAVDPLSIPYVREVLVERHREENLQRIIASARQDALAARETVELNMQEREANMRCCVSGLLSTALFVTGLLTLALVVGIRIGIVVSSLIALASVGIVMIVLAFVALFLSPWFLGGGLGLAAVMLRLFMKLERRRDGCVYLGLALAFVCVSVVAAVFDFVVFGMGVGKISDSGALAAFCSVGFVQEVVFAGVGIAACIVVVCCLRSVKKEKENMQQEQEQDAQTRLFPRIKEVVFGWLCVGKLEEERKRRTDAMIKERVPSECKVECEMPIRTRFVQECLSLDLETRFSRTACNCTRCLLVRDRSAGQLSGWSRFELKTFSELDVAEQKYWARRSAFHGTRIGVVGSILRDSLLMPGDVTRGGVLLQVQEGHCESHEVFCSRCLRYAACSCYAFRVKWEGRLFAIVVELGLNPDLPFVPFLQTESGPTIPDQLNVLGQGPQTLGLPPIPQFHARFDNTELEWGFRARGVHKVRALLISSIPFEEGGHIQSQVAFSPMLIPVSEDSSVSTNPWERRENRLSRFAGSFMRRIDSSATGPLDEGMQRELQRNAAAIGTARARKCADQCYVCCVRPGFLSLPALLVSILAVLTLLALSTAFFGVAVDHSQPTTASSEWSLGLSGFLWLQLLGWTLLPLACCCLGVGGWVNSNFNVLSVLSCFGCFLVVGLGLAAGAIFTIVVAVFMKVRSWNDSRIRPLTIASGAVNGVGLLFLIVLFFVLCCIFQTAAKSSVVDFVKRIMNKVVQSCDNARLDRVCCFPCWKGVCISCSRSSSVTLIRNQVCENRTKRLLVLRHFQMEKRIRQQECFCTACASLNRDLVRTHPLFDILSVNDGWTRFLTKRTPSDQIPSSEQLAFYGVSSVSHLDQFLRLASVGQGVPYPGDDVCGRVFDDRRDPNQQGRFACTPAFQKACQDAKELSSKSGTFQFVVELRVDSNSFDQGETDERWYTRNRRAIRMFAVLLKTRDYGGT